MHRRYVLIGVGLLVAVLAVGWLVKPARVRAQPGDATFVLVDEAGDEFDDVAFFEIDGDDGAGFNSFELSEGTHTLTVKPPPYRYVLPGQFTFEAFTLKLSVAGARATDTQRIEVVLPGALAWRLKRKLQDRAAEREEQPVDVLLLWPDGGPAAGVPVSCNGSDGPSDERGRRLCSTSVPFGMTLWARTPGLVAAAELRDGEDHVTLTLGPALDLSVVVLDGGVQTPVAVNSKRLQKELTALRTKPVSITAPLDRTIVCAGHPPFGACEVVVPPPDGGTRAITLAVDLVGSVRFEPRLHGEPVPSLIVYLDRVNSRVAAAPVQTFAALPGRHVLVLNTGTGPERFELVFDVLPGAETSLGVVELK